MRLAAAVVKILVLRHAIIERAIEQRERNVVQLW